MLVTQRQAPAEGRPTREIKAISQNENLPLETIQHHCLEGQIVVSINKNRSYRVVVTGQGLRTKINASSGTSTDIADIDTEVKKKEASC